MFWKQNEKIGLLNTLNKFNFIVLQFWQAFHLKGTYNNMHVENPGDILQTHICICENLMAMQYIKQAHTHDYINTLGYISGLF